MSARLGALVAHGRSADVFELPGGRVAKKYHDDWPDAAIGREIGDAETAFDLRLTPIRCHGRIQVDGGRAVSFDRVDGAALTTVAERNILRMGSVARALAVEHARIHRARTDAFPDVRVLAADLVGTAPLASLSASEKRILRGHLESLPRGDRPLHLDYHPLNVFEHDGGYAVIDWQSTATGDPAADVAMTRLLFTEAELFPGASALQRAVYGAARQTMGRMYLREYKSVSGLRDADIDRWATAARVLRLGTLDVPSERDRLLAGIRSGIRRFSEETPR
ncbi:MULTISPECIES: phosphotransferase [unclassified Microbacterium]|uniref:phosphotransferase n=1 Tax=unclassified Microbacterium TaxID=2609290 RepID=UPI003868086B